MLLMSLTEEPAELFMIRIHLIFNPDPFPCWWKAFPHNIPLPPPCFTACLLSSFSFYCFVPRPKSLFFLWSEQKTRFSTRLLTLQLASCGHHLVFLLFLLLVYKVQRPDCGCPGTAPLVWAVSLSSSFLLGFWFHPLFFIWLNLLVLSFCPVLFIL